MSVIQMESSTIHDVEKIFRVLQKHSIQCSLELKVEEGDDPLMSMVDAAVTIDYFEGVDGEKFLLLDLNGTEFSFSEKKCTFHKFISSSQVDICISSDRFSAWFNSYTLTLRAITEL